MKWLISIRKTFSEEKGAASVLVIFMMIVLVTLGAFALTSSNVNYKLSKKALDWNVMYYSLDSAAEEYVKDTDIKLALAENQMIEYINNEGFNKRAYDGIPQNIQNEIFGTFQSSPEESSLTSALNQLYMYYANENLAQLASDYPDCQVYALTDNGQEESIFTEINFQPEEEEHIDKYLKVSLRVNPVNYFFTFANGKISGERNKQAQRFKIESWYEWQAAVESDIIILWDGL